MLSPTIFEVLRETLTILQSNQTKSNNYFKDYGYEDFRKRLISSLLFCLL